ncbi:MFS transporter [Sandarakinorhabdus sp.]|uniref:MFS transporter n=1 Tax=Sandarakinorhabdus sp. TaxID=1916663 RepID=UPI00333FC02F
MQRLNTGIPCVVDTVRAEDVSHTRRVGALLYLLLGYFCYAWAWNTVDILRPYIRDSVGLTMAQSGWLYTMQSSGALIGAVVLGQVADRIGRRVVLMLVMVGFGTALLAGIVVADFAQLVAQRMAMGFFMGAMFPIAVGIYSGLFPADSRGLVAGIVMATYNIAVATLSYTAGQVIAAGHDWRSLTWIGVVPIVAAGFARWAIPDDRRMLAWGSRSGDPQTAGSLPIAELFVASVRRRTLALVMMTGLNFFAYQAFTGWATTYLKDVRQVDPALIGTVLAVQFLASALGGFAWGMISDRIGRRRAAFGFIGAALIIPVYLFVPMSDTAFIALGFTYGFMLSASTVWGPWLTELYPPHLRSTAASIFNWGRIISMTAPILTAALVPVIGMAPVMLGGCAAFLTAAVIWLRLPETVTARA